MDGHRQRLEHGEISTQIESAKAALAGIQPEGLGQRDLLSKKTMIQQTVGNLGQTIEEHAGHEEVILNMIKRAL